MSLKNLKQNMGNGLYIVSCDGMFAGANTVSGDFSLISKGYLLEDGKEILWSKPDYSGRKFL